MYHCSCTVESCRLVNQSIHIRTRPQRGCTASYDLHMSWPAGHMALLLENASNSPQHHISHCHVQVMPASSQSEGLTGTPLPPPDDAEEPMRTSISPLNAELAPPSSDAPGSSDPSGVAPGEKDDPNVGAQGGTSEETDQASQAGACRLVGSSAWELWLLCVLILPSLAQLRGCHLSACAGIRAWQRVL